MKKSIYFLVFIALFLHACSSDEDNNSNNSAGHVGKWEMDKVNIFPIGTVITGDETLYDFNFQCPTNKDYIRLGSEGAYKISTYDSDCIEEAEIGNYVKTDFVLNFYIAGELVDSVEIISLTANELKIKQYNPSTGIPEEIYVYSFKRVE